MRVLITGATGFIGGRSVQRLLRTYDVVCVGRSKPKAAYFADNGIPFFQGELHDFNFVKGAMENVDAILHCAGKAGAWGSYQDFYEANVCSTAVLLRAAQEKAVKRFVNISSPSIYFDFKNQFSLREGDLPANFSNFYAQSKYEAELLVKQAHSKSLQTVSLRPRLVIGAGDWTVLPRLIALQRKGLLFQIGDGKNLVDVTSVSNLLDAIELCLSSPSDVLGETYNISNGVPVEFWKWVDSVMAGLGEKRSRLKIPRGLMMGLARLNAALCKVRRVQKEPGLLPVSVAVLSQSMTLNIEKAKQKLKYLPRQSTEDAVKEFVEWWSHLSHEGSS